jgi:TonB family protein
MSLFASLLLNTVIAATPATPLPWYSFDDYPQKAFDRQWKGNAKFEVLVAPDGRPAACTITQSSGYDVLDRQTCWVVMKRARFTSARGPDGAPVFGTYRSVVFWHRPDQESLQGDPGPDLELTVDSLPAGTVKPPAVKLAYFVDGDGKPSSCTALPDSKAQPAALVDAACAQVFAKLAGTPNASGERQPTVRTAAVLFSTK